VLSTLFRRRTDRRLEPIGDKAFVFRQLVPGLHHRQAAARTGIDVFVDIHFLFAFNLLQFNILGKY